MRFVVLGLVAAIALAGCRAPYLSEYSDAIVQSDDLPEPGLGAAALTAWFEERGYVAGPRVLQAEAELRRRPGDPLVYSLPAERRWWLTAHRTIKHVCVTRRTIYYRVAVSGDLVRAIYNHGSRC